MWVGLQTFGGDSAQAGGLSDAQGQGHLGHMSAQDEKEAGHHHLPHVLPPDIPEVAPNGLFSGSLAVPE